MAQGSKRFVSVNAVYRNGVSLFDNKEIVADCIVTPRPGTTISVVTLRFAAQNGTAAEFLHAIQTGDAEFNIEGVAEQS